MDQSKYPENKVQDVKYPSVKPPDSKPAENRSDTQRVRTGGELEAAIAANRSALDAEIKGLSSPARPDTAKQEIKHVTKQAKEGDAEPTAELNDGASPNVSSAAHAAIEKASGLKDTAVDTAHQAADTIGKTWVEVGGYTRRFGQSAWRFTVANAVPLSLLGVGAGLMLSQRWRSRPEASQPRALSAGSTPAQRRGGQRVEEGDYAASGRSPAHEEQRTSAPEARQGKFEQLKGGVALGADVVRVETAHAVAGTKRTLKNGAVRSRDFLKQKWQKTQRTSSEFATAHPIALSFGALLTGLGIGLLLPATAREDMLFQASREKFRQAIGQARDLADDVTDMAKDTTTQVVAALEGANA